MIHQPTWLRPVFKRTLVQFGNFLDELGTDESSYSVAPEPSEADIDITYQDRPPGNGDLSAILSFCMADGRVSVLTELNDALTFLAVMKDNPHIDDFRHRTGVMLPPNTVQGSFGLFAADFVTSSLGSSEPGYHLAEAEKGWIGYFVENNGQIRLLGQGESAAALTLFVYALHVVGNGNLNERLAASLPKD